MNRRIEITAESLSVSLLPDKLARAGIELYSVRSAAKNTLTFEVKAKDREKVFAILRGSCYNIKKTRSRGLGLFCKKLRQSAGSLLGAALFLLLVWGAESRVLKIEVVGSGAYYGEEVRRVLNEEGISLFGPLPKNTSSAAAKILSFPRVDYCALQAEGGVVTVEVEVGEEAARKEAVSLLAPETGRVEELVVLRGRALVSEGEEVTKGSPVAEGVSVYGETELPAIVIARVKIAYPVREELEGSEERVRLAAYLKYGEISELRLTPSGRGFLVTGTAHAEASLNL